MNFQDLEARLSNNPHSPLFARLADEVLSLGRIEEAKQLCIDGLEYYPSYPSGNLVMAKCLAEEHDYGGALNHLAIALDTIPDAETLHLLKSKWESLRDVVPTTTIETQQTPSESNLPANEISEASVDVKEEPVQEGTTETVDIERPPVAEPESEVQASLVSVEILPPVEDILPANELSDAGVILEDQPVKESAAEVNNPEPQLVTRETIPPVKEDDEAEKRIVSKTLAEIYAQQHAFEEAILTYRLLQRVLPHRHDEFEERIRELETKLREKTPLS